MDRIQKWMMICLLVLFVPSQFVEASHNSRKGMYNNTLDLSTISQHYSYGVSITPEKPEKDDELTITMEVKDLDTLKYYDGKIEWVLKRDGLFGLKEVFRLTSEPFDVQNFPGTYGMKYTAENGGAYLLEVNVAGKDEWAAMEFEVDEHFHFDWKIAIVGLLTVLIGLGGYGAWSKKKKSKR